MREHYALATSGPKAAASKPAAGWSVTAFPGANKSRQPPAAQHGHYGYQPHGPERDIWLQEVDDISEAD